MFNFSIGIWQKHELDKWAIHLLPYTDRSPHPLTVPGSWQGILRCCSHRAWCHRLDSTECWTASRPDEWHASHDANTPRHGPPTPMHSNLPAPQTDAGDSSELLFSLSDGLHITWGQANVMNNRHCNRKWDK